MIIYDISDRYKLEFEKYYRKVNQNYICKYAVWQMLISSFNGDFWDSMYMFQPF